MKKLIITTFILVQTYCIHGMLVPTNVPPHRLTPDKLTPEEINDFLQGHPTYQDKDDMNKDESLAKILNHEDLNPFVDTIIRLIREGANPDMKCMGKSLLHRALLLNNRELIKVLLEKDVDCHDTDYVTRQPIFFDAQTVEIAGWLIAKGIHVNTVDGEGHNVLWHLMDPKFPFKLVKFYIGRKIQVHYICEFDNSCVLHSFAAYKEIKESDNKNFLAKAKLILLEAGRKLVTIKNNEGKTPIEIVEENRNNWGEQYPECVAPLKELKKLMDLFKDKEVV